MKKNKSTIILILVFFVGLSVMLYPTISDAVNRKHQSRAVAGYAEEVEQLSDADYQTYFDAADAYNRQLNTTPNAFYKPDLVSGYAQTLDISGTGIMGYITIPKISVELPIYHGTDEGVLQVAAGHLEGSSLPVGGAGTHAVISAHRGLPSAKLFTNLDELEVGDRFTITVLNRVLDGLCHPDDLHPLRHQHAPPIGARQAGRNYGKPKAYPCGGRCIPH